MPISGENRRRPHVDRCKSTVPGGRPRACIWQCADSLYIGPGTLCFGPSLVVAPASVKPLSYRAAQSPLDNLPGHRHARAHSIERRAKTHWFC